MYVASMNRIVGKLLNAEDFTLVEKRRIIRDLNEELLSLVEKSDDWFTIVLNNAYKEGSSDVMGYLRGIGVKNITYTREDQEIIDSAIANVSEAVRSALSGVSKSSSRILDSATKEKLRSVIFEGKEKGSTLREIKGKIVEKINKGGVRLIDSAGRSWTADAYAEMLGRTEYMNMYNNGVVSQMLHKEQDLAYITSYATCQCDICQQWEEKVVSLTGKTEGYPTLDDALGEGMFHPNCLHRLRPYIKEFTEEFSGYSKQEAINAVKDYQDQGYTLINGVLRGTEEDLPELRNKANQISALIEKEGDLKDYHTLYRGDGAMVTSQILENTPKGYDIMKEFFAKNGSSYEDYVKNPTVFKEKFNEMFVGSVFKDEGFLSTTYDRDLADKSFVNPMSDFTPYGIPARIEISGLDKTKGIKVSDYTGINREKEVLLQKGLSLRIDETSVGLQNDSSGSTRLFLIIRASIV